MKKLVKIGLIAFAIFAVPVNASMTDFVDHGMYTTDTRSKLDWLDVTKTINKSFNQVTTLLEDGGELEGWRYATGIEFNQMLVNYSDQVSPIAEYKTVHYAQGLIDGLVDLLGSTSDFDKPFRGSGSLDDLTYAYGLISDFAFSPASKRVRLALIKDYDVEVYPTKTDTSNPHNGHALKDDKHSGTGQSIGSYLVRDTELTVVPLPATLWFMGSGLLGLMGIARNRKSN